MNLCRWSLVPLVVVMSLTGGPALGSPATDGWEVGDDTFTLRLTRSRDGGVTETCRADGVDLPYRGVPGALLIAGEAWQELCVAEVSAQGDTVQVRGEIAGLGWRLTYERAGRGLIRKSLALEPRADVLLQRVALAAFSADPEPEIVSTSLQDIAAFIRRGDRGMFVSLDFPYSRITTEGGCTRVAYPAWERLAAGTVFPCHSLTLGVTRPSNERRYGRDTGEVAAMDAYVQTRHAPRFDRPMLVSACINNRYTMPRAGMVWYTYKDHPTLSFNLDIMRRELDFLSLLGVEYYQVFPGVFDWVPDDPAPSAIREMVDYGRARGVRLGDYSGCNSVFCPHYNEHGNSLAQPGWQMRDAQQNAGAFCFGCPGFVDYYINTVVPAAREYGFQLHCLDFLGIAPCYAEHGHPAGADSIYHQVAGLMRMMQAVAEVDPNMMVWSNSGNWSEFLPKIAWWNPNLYLTDPFIATPWPGLNMTRLLDDARREQMVSLHYTHFLPFRNFTNCQYFFSQNSVVPDIRNYQYGALSSLAVTPNLCLAEIRPWWDRLPTSQQQEVTAFYQRWTRLLRAQYPLWKQTYHCGDDPAPGGIEVYSHAEGDHGFVFVVNPNYWSGVAHVPLDQRLGFSGHDSCELAELYPTERLVLTPAGPTPSYGTTVTLEAPAQQVRVLEVRPAPRMVDMPRVYGVSAALERTSAGYLLKTSGPQGTSHRFAIRAPDDSAPLSSATVRPDVPRQALRLASATDLTLLGGRDPYTLWDIRFRRSAAATELRQWHVCRGDVETGLAQGWPQGIPLETQVAFPRPAPAGQSNHGSVLTNFAGAYIDNAFGEEQETWIDLTASGTPSVTDTTIVAADPQRERSGSDPVSDEAASWWLQTTFHLPFMYTIGAEPAFDEHTVLVLPMFDPTRVTELRAWVNGQPLEVQRYAYPRNRSLSTWWADLVGTGAQGGDNVLVVYVH